MATGMADSRLCENDIKDLRELVQLSTNILTLSTSDSLYPLDGRTARQS